MILFALLCCVCMIFIFKKERILLNPVTVFISVWLLATFLAGMKLSKWHSGIDEKTLLTLGLVILAFTFSYYILCRLFRSNEKLLNFGNCCAINNSLKRWLIIVWIVFSVIEVLYSGGIPLFWHIQDSGKTYFDYGIPSVHGLMNSVGLVIILLCFYDVLKEKKRVANLLVIGLLLAYYALLLTRQVIISAVVEMAVVAFLMRKRKWSVTKLAAILIASILAFGLLGNIRTGYEEFMYVAQMHSDIPKPLVGFYWVYMYLSMTIANLNELITGFTDYIGLSAFSGAIPSIFAPLLGLDTGFYSADYLVTPAFNVSGFFVNAYLGFGVLGATVYSALYGSISAFASTRLANRNNELNVLIYAVVLQIISLSFFDDMLLYLPSSFQIVLLIVLSCVSKKLKDGMECA